MSEQSDSSSRSLCSCDRQSCLLFARRSGERCRPTRMLLTGLAQARPLQGEFSGPSKTRSYQLIITRQIATATEQFKQLARKGEHPQGQTGPGDADTLYGLGEKTTPGPTSSAHQAGKSSPASDAEAHSLLSSQTYICEQQQGKKPTDPHSSGSKDTGTTGERNLAANSKVSAEQ